MSVSIGDVFSRMTVVKEPFNINGRKVVECLCSCGVVKIVRVDGLQGGTTNSCGCYRLDKLREKTVTHGATNTKTYSVWEGMLQRCNNPKSSGYPNYGGRGITICNRWLGETGFENFLKDMGEKPKYLTLDRIDVNGNYSQENCRWADVSLQSFNTRLSSNNTSGRTGVSWDKTKRKWSSYIMKDRKKIHLGRYDTLEDAILAREKGELKYFGMIKEI